MTTIRLLWADTLSYYCCCHTQDIPRGGPNRANGNPNMPALVMGGVAQAQTYGKAQGYYPLGFEGWQRFCGLLSNM